jgi:hypothetical protein
MTPLLIILGILLLLVLLLSVRARLGITLQDEVCLTLRVLFLKFTLFPKKSTPKKILKEQKKKEKKQKKAKSKRDKQSASDAEAKKKQRKKRSFSDILRMIKLICRILKRLWKRFPGYFRLRLSKVKISVGGADAAQAAIRYGAVSAAVAYLITLCEQFATVRTNRKSELQISPDYFSDRIDCKIDIELSITLRSLLALALRALCAFLKERKKPSKPSSKPPVSRSIESKQAL